MTEQTYDPAADLAQQFLAALPDGPRCQIHHTARVIALVHRAVRDHGWTVDQLVTECTRDLRGITNAGGLITFRLENAASGPPAAGSPLGRVVPFCSPECRDNAGWVLDSGGMPASRCPCRTPQEVSV